jgi:hypothetical protein
MPTYIAFSVTSILTAFNGWFLMAIATLPLFFVAGLPGLHGILTAKSVLRSRRQTHSRQRFQKVELACSGLLVLAGFVMLVSVVFQVPSFIVFFFGGLLAAIATLPLIITGLLKVITAVRQKRDIWQNLLKVVLNVLALLIYLVLAAWMSMLFIFWLTGEPYMGN